MEHYYIYCLHNENLPEYYVGHTKDLKERIRCHNKNSKKLNFKVYQYIRNNGGINNFKMEVLDEIYCDLENAKKLERYYTELLGATLNSDVPGRTQKEYYRENKEKIKEYYQDNKEKIKEYYQDNKPEISEKAKEYRQDNKEKISEQKKEYYQNNKEKISEKAKEKFTCICGSVTRKRDYAQHWKSKKHINFIRENIGY